MTRTPGKHVEYQVREVKRYIVTRYENEVTQRDIDTDSEASGKSSIQGSGEYPNWDMAYQVGYALARLEHEQLGYDLGDMRIKYPQSVPEGEPITQTSVGVSLG